MSALAAVGLVCATPAWAASDREPSKGSKPPASVPALRLHVDATESPRKLLHARIDLPVRPGPLTLVYPKWIPGEHGPTGPIGGLAGLSVRAAGRPVSWRRDPGDMYSFHVEVPPGTSSLEVTLDFLSSVVPSAFTAGSSASSRLLVINWNHVLLLPDGVRPRDLTVAASVRLPPGWRFGTALAIARQSHAGKGAGGDQAATRDSHGVEFRPVSAETLVDSPLIAGEYFRTIDLLGPTDKVPHFLHVAGDSAAALAFDDAKVDGFRRLVTEAGVLFGSRPYRHYHFLLALSDHIAHFGLEHHESSDNRLRERALLEPEMALLGAGLLPHELVHSWNGKHRRPAELATPDFQQPGKTGLLWVYEGLTTYLGEVLTARSGLRTLEQQREALALTAAQLDAAPGRTWRSLEDTAVAAQILFGSPGEWRSWRRGVDFYPESLLIWLEADTIIRRKTSARRSLDDFCRAFHGRSDQPIVVPYSIDDVLAALGGIAPHDWRAFFAERVDRPTSRAPLGGLEAAGWRLAFRDTPTGFLRALEQRDKGVNLTFSLGVSLKEDGTIVDVVPGQPAARAGLGPGMRVIAVNSRRFSPDGLRAAVRATRTRPDVEVLVENGEDYRSHRLSYRGGARYPVLERIPDRPDLLTTILSAGGKAPAPAPAPPR